MKYIIFFVLIVIVIGGGGFFVMKNMGGKNNLPNNQVSSPVRKKADVNWDEVVNQTDVNMIQAQVGCKKADACWNQVVGKTVTGDNPIYTFDLDLNSDGVIDQTDVAQTK